MSIGTRIRTAREAADLTQHDLAKQLGVSRSAVAQWEAGKNAPTMDKIEELSTALGQAGEWIVSGKGTMRQARAADAVNYPKGTVATNVKNMKPVRVVGAIQAGVWLEAVEWPVSEQYEMPLPILPPYHNTPVVALEVRGPSMDVLYPDGSLVVCVKFMDLGRRPRHGERVVALRMRNGEVEATVKEFRIDPDGTARLWPRSSHPQFQQPVDVTPDKDGPQVAYLVIGSYRPEG